MKRNKRQLTVRGFMDCFREICTSLRGFEMASTISGLRRLIRAGQFNGM